MMFTNPCAHEFPAQKRAAAGCVVDVQSELQDIQHLAWFYILKGIEKLQAVRVDDTKVHCCHWISCWTLGKQLGPKCMSYLYLEIPVSRSGIQQL